MPGFNARHVAVSAIAVTGLALVASAQDWTTRPQPTQARVWVENRKPTEAVPVNVMPPDRPLPIAVSGTPTVTTSAQSVVSAKSARQAWDYRALRVAAGQDPLAAGLIDAGRDGWETTGIMYPSGNDMVLVLKRPL